MNKTLMITVSVAALFAAGGMAFAQSENEPRDKPAAATPVEKGKSDRLKPDTHKTEAVKPTPSAQLPAKPAGAKSETSGQGTGMPPAQRDATPPRSDRSAPKADAQHAAPAALSSEQHAKIWQTLRREKMARFTGERFSMTVGEVVPQTVHLNRLPVRVIAYAPQYRGYEYIQVGEEILIVDPRTHRIVAVVAA
jgi:Protein of unknown function (DUF1236)